MRISNMAKEILVYGTIYSGSVERFINAMNDVMNEPENTIRFNSNGGSPEDNIGMLAKMKEYKGKLNIKIDGKAHSTAAFALLYADPKNIEATDLSKSTFHRAAYPSWIENNKEYMTPEMWAYLDGVNKPLREAMEARIDSSKWEEITGTTLDELFSNDSRIDVTLDAKQMKTLGIIGKINTITPKREQELTAMYHEIAAQHKGIKVSEVQEIETEVEASSDKSNSTHKTKRKMTVDQLKAEHPELFASIHASGVDQERERVKAILVYHSVDAKKSVELVNAGTELSASQREEFNLKAITNKEITAIENDSTDPIDTPNLDEPEPNAVSDFEKSLEERRKARKK